VFPRPGQADSDDAWATSCVFCSHSLRLPWLLGCAGIGGGAGDASETLNLKAAGAAVQRAPQGPVHGEGGAGPASGGGGGKAQREAAAVLAAMEKEKVEKERRQAQARKEAKEAKERGGGRGGEGGTEGSGKGKEGAERGAEKGQGRGKSKKGHEGSPGSSLARGAPAMSVVDAASASVAGRSTMAAKASDESKTRAKVAACAAGERVPVAENSKWVSPFSPHLQIRCATQLLLCSRARTEHGRGRTYTGRG